MGFNADLCGFCYFVCFTFHWCLVERSVALGTISSPDDTEITAMQQAPSQFIGVQTSKRDIFSRLHDPAASSILGHSKHGSSRHNNTNAGDVPRFATASLHASSAPLYASVKHIRSEQTVMPFEASRAAKMGHRFECVLAFFIVPLLDPVSAPSF